MIEHTVKKSCILIDTPANCFSCPLSAAGDDYGFTIRCPLLDTIFSENVPADYKDDNCPLKEVEISLKLDI